MRIPGPKWGAGRPPLETPKSRCAIRIGRTPRRLRGWSFGAVGESASACALATTAAPPPLRGGGCAPLPPRSPLGNVCRSSLGASPPCVPRWGTFAGHARLLGAAPPCPPRSPLGDVCRSCAPIGGCAPCGSQRRSSHGTTFFCGNAQISRKLLPRKRLGVPSLPSRGCAEGTLARPPVGESQRGRSPLWPVFAYFLLARK